ncbi:MAG TPA: serine/threonine-protein kinase, partial [Polyangia bacterium]
DGGALVVIVAVPSQPLYAHGALRGAVAVATRVELTALTASLAPSGLGAELLGAGDPVTLTARRPVDGARMVTVPVPLGDLPGDGAAPTLVLRATVRPGGGGALWAGRVLLVAAFLAALLTFAAHRARPMPSLDDAPTAPRDTRTTPHALAYGAALRDAPQPNAPRLLLEPLPTAKEKRGDPRGDGNRLVLAWSATMPTPITQLEPAQESAPNVVDPRGDQLAGRYRLLQPIGRGHSSDVYLAQSFVAGAPSTVALKILSGPDSGDRRAFLEAAARQMRVTHPHVAQIIDVGDGAAGEVAYVAMEYVEGCTLEVLLRDLFARDEPLPLPQTLAIMAALCRALDAARPLVHGAVKPSNVLVGRHNVVKLADFGAPPSATDRHAPEKYAGKAPDRRSDVYAAGVVLHELVTGRRMDTGGVDPKRWPPLPAPSAVRPGLPRGLDAVVAKATRFGPRGRYGSAGELLAALLRATEEAVEGAQSGWLGDWVERARRSVS